MRSAFGAGRGGAQAAGGRGSARIVRPDAPPPSGGPPASGASRCWDEAATTCVPRVACEAIDVGPRPREVAVKRTVPAGNAVARDPGSIPTAASPCPSGSPAHSPPPPRGARGARRRGKEAARGSREGTDEKHLRAPVPGGGSSRPESGRVGPRGKESALPRPGARVRPLGRGGR